MLSPRAAPRQGGSQSVWNSFRPRLRGKTGYIDTTAHHHSIAGEIVTCVLTDDIILASWTVEIRWRIAASPMDQQLRYGCVEAQWLRRLGDKILSQC